MKILGKWSDMAYAFILSFKIPFSNRKFIYFIENFLEVQVSEIFFLIFI